MTVNRARRFPTVVLVAALAWTLAIPPALSSETARLHGRVVAADGATPRAGVVVTLVHAERGTRVNATPSDARGAFRLDAAAPGTYRVLAEGPDGAFLAPGAVTLAAGENPPVALALLAPAQQTDGDEAEATDEEDQEQGEDPSPPEAPTGLQLPPPPEEKGLPTLAKWLIGGGVGVLAVLAINETGNSEDPASPF